MCRPVTDLWEWGQGRWSRDLGQRRVAWGVQEIWIRSCVSEGWEGTGEHLAGNRRRCEQYCGEDATQL